MQLDNPRLLIAGAIAFGLVLGWVTSTLLCRGARGGLTDLAIVVGALAGPAVTHLHPPGSNACGAYCVALAVGFFVRLLVARRSCTPADAGKP